MRKKTFTAIFTLEVDGKPTLTFQAAQLREAHELSREEWLRNDLGALRSNGVPLCRPNSTLRVRMANEAEQAMYGDGALDVSAGDDLILVYLVGLDDKGEDGTVGPGEFPPDRRR